VEDLFDGIVGKNVGFGFGPLQMELYVTSRIVEAERFEAVSKCETGAEGFQDAELEDLEQAFDAADEDAETVFGVEVVCGESSQDVGDIGVKPLGVVEDENGMSASFLLMIDQKFLCGVEKIDGVILMESPKQRQMKRRKPCTVEGGEGTT